MKTVLFFSCLFISVCGAFGLGFSYGGGGALVFSPVTFNGSYGGTSSSVTSGVSVTSMQFLDANYVEISIGYSVNRGSTEPTAASTTTGFAVVLTGVSFGAAVKYPIVIGPVAIFPIIGAEYRLNLTWTDDKSDDLKAGLGGSSSALDELWVKGGLGVDVNFGSLFLRPIVMVGYMPGSPGSVTSTHPTGTISFSRGSLAVDVRLLFGCRL
jgi:hypothetical protein